MVQGHSDHKTTLSVIFAIQVVYSKNLKLGMVIDHVNLRRIQKLTGGNYVINEFVYQVYELKENVIEKLNTFLTISNTSFIKDKIINCQYATYDCKFYI